LTGSYKTSLDDSFAIKESLEPVSLWAFLGIVGITIVFFRRLTPCLIVMTGMVLGTVLTMGFCRISVGQLNMITSILGGILMGFGVDYGIHFIFRTRIELGLGKPVHEAVAQAFVQAGRPAAVAAVVTGGSFLVLMISDFKGFSQFGFLAGVGTLIMGLTMFVWCAAWVALLGHWVPTRVNKLIGTMQPPGHHLTSARKVPRPKVLLGACGFLVLVICTLAVSRTDAVVPVGDSSWRARLLGGVRFNYNSRSLMALSQTSVILQDEINRRFSISSDPVAVYTQDLQQARALYDELTVNKDKYRTIDQVMSIFTFVPPQEQARANARIMHAWHDELASLDDNLLTDEQKISLNKLRHALLAEPFDVLHLPQIYASQFYNLPSAKPENRGLLTFIYPRVDLWDGQQMLRFADEVNTIRTSDGQAFHAAGPPLLFAQLARTVLADGRHTLVLAALWILVMHFLDFRSVVLAVASVLPLCLGLGMMLGLMALSAHPLNFMNIIMLPILLGFGVSHGLYLLHRFLEGVPAGVALRSVGAAVASSTLTAVAGFASLFAASHQGLQSMGYVACLGLCTTLVASFSVLAAVLQIIDDRRHGDALPLTRTE
jgi:predicted RND superfamily exporter protein